MGRGKDQPTRFLTHDERETLFGLITTRLETLRPLPLDADNWVAYRDLALVSTLLGAGLKVEQLSRLTLNCVDLSERRIDLSRTAHTHRARILAFAVEPISVWLKLRAHMDTGGGQSTGGALVFPADRDRAGFGRHAKTAALHASSVYRRVLRFLVEAGITGDRASAQTLRNTYAAQLIEAGASDEQLVDYLGLNTSITAHRIRTAYENSTCRRPDGAPDGPKPFS